MCFSIYIYILYIFGVFSEYANREKCLGVSIFLCGSSFLKAIKVLAIKSATLSQIKNSGSLYLDLIGVGESPRAVFRKLSADQIVGFAKSVSSKPERKSSMQAYVCVTCHAVSRSNAFQIPKAPSHIGNFTHPVIYRYLQFSATSSCVYFPAAPSQGHKPWLFKNCSLDLPFYPNRNLVPFPSKGFP